MSERINLVRFLRINDIKKVADGIFALEFVFASTPCGYLAKQA